MPWEGVALALLAAVVHALWNLLVAGAPPRLPGLAAISALGAVATAPTFLLGDGLDRDVLALAAVSSTLETAYFVLLVHAYRRADASLVYPVARGAAPLVALAGAVALGTATVAPREAVGVAIVCAGIVAVRGVGGSARVADVGLALLVACAIAAYTLVDAHAVRELGAPPGPYLATVLALAALQLAVLAVVRGEASDLRELRDRRVVLAGLGVSAAYLLVLLAFARAPAPLVAALRETSVVVATALAAVVLRERVPRLRIAGAVAVAAGVALIVA